LEQRRLLQRRLLRLLISLLENSRSARRGICWHRGKRAIRIPCATAIVLIALRLDGLDDDAWKLDDP
jgi:hypothetical protein